MKLRPYQSACLDSIDAYWRGGGGNPLVVMATGLGKSVIFAEKVRRIIERFPHMRIAMLVHVQELVEQNYNTLRGLWAGASIGIYSAGLGRKDTHQRVICANIQSIYKRTREVGAFDLIVVDEAHLVPAEGEGMYLQFFEDQRKITPDMRVLGLTATPFRLDSGNIVGRNGALFDEIVFNYGIREGIEDGWLAPITARRSGVEIDVQGVAKRGGEFVAGGLEKAAMHDDLIAAACEATLQRGGDRNSWLMFCSGVNHAYAVAEAMRGLGIETQTITGDTPKAERKQIINAFKGRRIRCLTNANVLCLDHKTEILTSSGWTSIDDMTYDHQVASWDFDGSVVFAPPQNIVRRSRQAHEKMVSVDSARNNIRVTGNHRMVVREQHTAWRIEAAEDVAYERVHIPVSGVAAPLDISFAPGEAPDATTVRARVRSLSYVYRKRGMTVDAAKVAAELHVNRRARMETKSPKLLSLDECRFIGFWLGDGTLSPRCEFSQSCVYPKIIEWFDGVLARLNLAHSRAERNGVARWSIARGTGGSDQARESGYFPLEAYLDKKGVPEFWALNEEQFAALLEGFWMADGNHGDGETPNSRGINVAGAQSDLYDLLQAVGACRGYRFTKSPLANRNPEHSDQWKLSWRKRESVELTVDRLSIETDFRIERVWCVTSVTGNIITRRGGKVAVVGNTTGFDAPGVDLIGFLRPTLSGGLYTQMIGRGTRPIYEPGFEPNDATREERRASIAAGAKANCLVLDFAGNVMRHGPVDMVEGRDKKPKGEGDGKVAVNSVQAKLCPNCDALNDLRALECVDCGYEYPVKEKHAAEPDENVAVISTEVTNQGVRVDHWNMVRHEKIGAPNSMCVTYYAGLSQHREWICFEHDGPARRRAVEWWKMHGGQIPAPDTVTDGLRRVGELTAPSEIFVEPQGKFWRIAGRRWPEEFIKKIRGFA